MGEGCESSTFTRDERVFRGCRGEGVLAYGGDTVWWGGTHLYGYGVAGEGTRSNSRPAAKARLAGFDTSFLPELQVVWVHEVRRCTHISYCALLIRRICTEYTSGPPCLPNSAGLCLFYGYAGPPPPNRHRHTNSGDMEHKIACESQARSPESD
jgi:hypothetical protein